MKEILVGISPTQESELKKLSQRSRRSRAALIREAIDQLIDQEKLAPAADAFGLWGKGEDGLSYQRRLRDEW